MSPGFNVATGPAVPARAVGTVPGVPPDWFGLHDLLARAHELADVAVPVPPAESVLRRVLSVLAARVTGLDNPRLRGDAWYERHRTVWRQGRFDPSAVDEYFTRYADRFDLFDPDRPWLQDPRLAEQCDRAAGVNKLVFVRPSGQNQVWFDHTFGGESAPAAEAAWYLLAVLGYGPSGRCSSRRVGAVKEANSTAGPLRSTLSFHPVGSTLFETLVAGLCPPEPSRRPDVAPWEADELPDPLAPPSVPGGFAALVGRFQHAVLLAPGPDGEHVTDAWITWGRRDKLPPIRDPYLVHQPNKQGEFYARPADADRAVFRDLDALLSVGHGGQGVRRPAVLDTVQQLGAQAAGGLRVRALGFDQDGQTRDRQWFAQETPPVLGLLEEFQPAAASAVARWRRDADLAARNLRWALDRFWLALNDPKQEQASRRRDLDVPFAQRADSAYWAQAERLFWSLVDAGDWSAGTLPFFRAARDIYDALTDLTNVSPRWVRAAQRARRLIFAGYRPVAGQPTEGSVEHAAA